jgi:hypothetical protein
VGGGVGPCGVVAALVASIVTWFVGGGVAGAFVDAMLGSLVDAIVGTAAVGAFVGGGTSTHS